VASIRQALPGEIVAIDNRTLRRSHNRAAGLAPLHLVGVWATNNRVVLGQAATEAKSNEIKGIPRLLELLRLKGCIPGRRRRAPSVRDKLHFILSDGLDVKTRCRLDIARSVVEAVARANDHTFNPD
jgi:hypothetical protein